MARVAPADNRTGGSTVNCPVISRGGNGPAKAGPTIKLIDHRDVRQQAGSADRRKDLVNTPEVTMSDTAESANLQFLKEQEEAKMHEFWVFPEECTGVFMDKKTGLAYANVCIIGVNGRQYPLFPGNNRAPSFVYEALEDNRELRRRFKEKLAPPKSTGRRVLFSDNRSRVGGHGEMLTNQAVFSDSMLGKPNFYDRGINQNASELIRQNRQKYFKERGINNAK